MDIPKDVVIEKAMKRKQLCSESDINAYTYCTVLNGFLQRLLASVTLITAAPEFY